MTNNKNHIKVNYNDEQLRILVEEFITMQKHEFTFKGLYSYVLYWAKEEGCTSNMGLYESDLLSPDDCDRLGRILEQIVKEGRIAYLSCGNTDNAVCVLDDSRFVKK